jgi:hypothetical protein
MRCKCGLADVTRTDHVDLSNGVVRLHGRAFCEAWTRGAAGRSAGFEPDAPKASAPPTTTKVARLRLANFATTAPQR